MNYTANEAAVFKVIAEISMDGSVAGISDLDGLGLTRKQIGGVLASLVTKGKIQAEDASVIGREQEIDYWPVHSQYGGGIFWCDYVTQEEFDSELIEES